MPSGVLPGGVYPHLLPHTEHVDELCEVDGSGTVRNHLVNLLVGQGNSNLISSGTNISTTDDTVLVTVHELEAFLEFGDLERKATN